jgi:hypothetical protein
MRGDKVPVFIKIELRLKIAKMLSVFIKNTK